MKLPRKPRDTTSDLKPRDILDSDPRHPYDFEQPQGYFYVCTHCREDFIPTRFWNHFCSKECRVAHHQTSAKRKSKLNRLA